MRPSAAADGYSSSDMVHDYGDPPFLRSAKVVSPVPERRHMAIISLA
jgi:hypothetical protein